MSIGGTNINVDFITSSIYNTKTIAASSDGGGLYFTNTGTS